MFVRIILAPVNKVHHVHTVTRVAEMLGEDESNCTTCRIRRMDSLSVGIQPSTVCDADWKPGEH